MDYNNNYSDPYQEKPPANGLAIASLVLGIIAIPAGCCYGFGILLGIIGLILGIISKGDTGKMSTMALVGVICSIVGILIGVGFWVLFAIGLNSMGGWSGLTEYMNQNGYTTP